jgi:hypothetical protein
MKVIIFQGGLGNQIFQYEFLKSYEKYTNEKVYYVFRKGAYSHNGLEINKYFNVNIKQAPFYIKYLFKILDKFKQKGIIIFFTNENKELYPKKGLFLDGYWQNKSYLKNDLISFKNIFLNKRNTEIKLLMQSTYSVAIHIRRGDYLLPHFQKIYGNICTLEYYKRAIDICYKQNKNCHFFIFSDDIEWSKKNFSSLNPTFIDWNTGDNSVIDLYLMSQAKINIIANSTFSFWGAYLNTNNIITIYPKKWYNSQFEVPDIFPIHWIGI